MIRHKLYSALLFSLYFGALSISCNQDNQSKSAHKGAGKGDNYDIGDCFEFKERIRDFGVVFLENKNYPDGRQYNLFPVKLDTTKTGIDKFRFGRVYITQFIDYTKASLKTEGFMVYHFLHQTNFEQINKFFTHVGDISIKERYMNATGGTIAESFAEFRLQLDLWEKIFGQNGELTVVDEICW
jgi:hypothetical protein